ncbi:MAG: GNAT family N-acetyltransferase [Sciscionella sp.]|nr:GNAT family N-acetyltransferase [Sciscionella sp.]
MRIGLRRWRASDAEWYAEQSQDPEILKWTSERPGLHPSEVREAIAAVADDNSLAWVAVEADTGQRLGNAAVDIRDGVAEPSYWVAAAARGNGVATEILRLLVAKTILAGYRRVELVIAEGNAASRRVAEKVGFVMFGFERRRNLGSCVRYQLPARVVDELVALADPNSLASISVGRQPVAEPR